MQRGPDLDVVELACAVPGQGHLDVAVGAEWDVVDGNAPCASVVALRSTGTPVCGAGDAHERADHGPMRARVDDPARERAARGVAGTGHGQR